MTSAAVVAPVASVDTVHAVLVTFESRVYVARAAHRDAVTAQDRAEGGDEYTLGAARLEVARTAGRYVEAREAYRIVKSHLA